MQSSEFDKYLDIYKEHKKLNFKYLSQMEADEFEKRFD